MRALHLALDDAPPVLDDHLAATLLPAYQQRFIRRLALLSPAWRVQYRLRRQFIGALRAQIVVRSRYAEDVFEAAAGAQAARVVLLAAGLDTFAYRIPRAGIEVLEIDHPATQGWKLALLDERGISAVDRVQYRAIDFEHQALAAVWPHRVGTDLISWLGVSYYLSREAVLHTLGELAAITAGGTRLVLDYWHQPPPAASGSALLWSTRLGVAALSEPMQSFFEPEDMQQLAVAAGWRVVEHLDADAQTRRYLVQRNDGLALPPFAHLLQLEH